LWIAGIGLSREAEEFWLVWSPNWLASKHRFTPPARSLQLESRPHQHPHVELTMAPHAGFETDQIKDKAKKDLLYLLEGVSKGSHTHTRKAAANVPFNRFEERRTL
jgi:hypothetical protein